MTSMIALLLANIALLLGVLIAINLPVARLGLDFDDDEPRRRLWFEPPGYVIPLAWFVLFTLLGIARYTLVRDSAGGAGPWLILLLAVCCASHAYYTLGLSRLTGLSALWFGLAGNLVVIVLALFVAWQVSAVSSTAAFLILPVAAWTAFATAIVVGEMKVTGLIR